MSEKPEFKYEVNLKATKWARNLVKAYPKKFSFVNPEHVYCVIDKKAESADQYARISLVPAKLEPLFGFGIIIEIWYCNWKDLSPAAKKLVLLHELTHLRQDEGLRDFDKPYKTIKHDVQEFEAFLSMFGVHWTHRDDLPDPLKVEVKLGKVHTGMPTMG